MTPFAAHARCGIPGNTIPKNGNNMCELRPTTTMKSMAATNRAFFGVHNECDLNGNLVRIQRSVAIITSNHAENNCATQIVNTRKRQSSSYATR